MSTFYSFYQTNKDDKWHLFLSSDKDRIIADVKPELITVLDVDCSFSHDLTPEEQDKLKYRGPLYFDFDADSIEEVTPQFQAMLTNLKAKGVRLEQCRLFLSGGKGYHIEIPSQIFAAKPSPHGTAKLPAIYREMAHDMFVEMLDLRVYTAKRGRQWRCPNIKRANGKYKVQITAEEAMNIDEDMYADLIKHPRPLFQEAPPEFCPDLALVYSQARDKVEAFSKRKKSKVAALATLAPFKGQWPATMRDMLNGQGIKENVGWNKIALQIAIMADALHKTEEQTLADAEPLIESYSGDSARYNSVVKRRNELRNQIRYITGCLTYEYSPGGILSLLTAEAIQASDLQNGGYVADAALLPEGELIPDGELPATEEDGDARVRISKAGMFAKYEQGWQKISDLGISNINQVRSLRSEILGYEVDLHIPDEPVTKTILPLNAFMSKQSLLGITMGRSVSMTGTDLHASLLADVLRKRVKKMNKVTYVVQSEGMDLIVPPGASEITDYDMVWAAPSGVTSRSGNPYRHGSSMDSSGAFQSDLFEAPDLTLEDAEMIEHLLELNTAANVGRLLGWYSAAFLTPVFRRMYNQFPSLQVFGEAGAGKSATATWFTHLHYYMSPPKIMASQGQTTFAVLSAVTASSSIPVIFDEFKPRELSKSAYDLLLSVFRNNYRADTVSRGGLSKDPSIKGTVVNKYGNRCPLCFIGESLEQQTAIMERCVIVTMTKQDREGRDQHNDWLINHGAHNIGKLGRAMLHAALHIDFDKFKEEVRQTQEEVKTRLLESGVTQKKLGEMSRPVFNYTVTMMGLRFANRVIQRTFSGMFDEKFQRLEETLMLRAKEHVPSARSEATKVLDVMARLTRIEDMQFKLVRGRDYTVNGDHVDIRLHPAFDKYLRYCRNLGLPPLYDNDAAFVAAMSKYSGVITTACPDNPELFRNMYDPLYRFSAEALEKEEIQPFEN